MVNCILVGERLHMETELHRKTPLDRLPLART
jgi:hypothetical protein